MNLEEKRDAYPQTLSGGQKQRVAIARALAANTRILLCDEPTSALDLETTKSVLDVLKRVNEQLGVTIVVITHELDVVKGICDRIAVMDGGRVVEQGETYEVFSNPQSEMLRGLVRHSQNFALPSGAFEQNGSIIKLTYAGESATEPVLFDAGKLFDVRLSILHGKIEYINEKPFGILYVRAEGAFMCSIALVIAIVAGGALGILLYASSTHLFINSPLLNKVLGATVNVVRSIPFLILLIFLLPLSALIVGTKIGTEAVVIPLAVAAVAFFARLSEASLAEVDKGMIEAAFASGAGKLKTMFCIVLPEAHVPLVKDITITAISLLGFSAMAGLVGGPRSRF